MLLTRRYEDRAQELWSQGLVVESLHGSQGQEAIGVGVCFALRPEDGPDSITAYPRGLPRSRRARAAVPGRHAGKGDRGREWQGDGTPHGAPRAASCWAAPSSVRPIPVATGAALAFQMRDEDRVAVCFFGDGSAQRGDFHEALNFAGVMQLPVVYVIENNGYAEFTPIAKHFAGNSLAIRAEGYGFGGVTVDGNDVLAVYDAAAEAPSAQGLVEGRPSSSA